MEIASDVLPLQYWPIDDDTFNESPIYFADNVPYNHEIQKDDPLKHQVRNQDDITKDYQLKIVDKDGNFFTFPNPVVLPALATWANLGAGINWTTGPVKFHSGIGAFATSKFWGIAFSLLPGAVYVVDFDVSNVPDTNINFIKIVSLDAGDNLVEVLYQVNISTSVTVELRPTLVGTKIAVYAQTADALTNEDVTINTFSLVSSRFELDPLNFVQSLVPGTVLLDFLNTTFPLVIAPWLNYNAGSGQVNFVWNAANDAFADGTASGFRQTSILYQPRPDGYHLGWTSGIYSIHLIGSNASTGADRDTMYAQAMGSNDGVTWVSLGVSAAIPFGAFDFNLIATIPFAIQYKYLGFLFNIGPPGNVIKVHVNKAEQVNLFQAEYDLNFQLSELLYNLLQEGCYRFYIQESNIDKWKSELIKVLDSVRLDTSWGSFLIGYKSLTNFAGICYPIDGGYFYLRVPCQFFRQRPKSSQEILPLSGNQVISTAISSNRQQLMKTIYLPDYMHNKIQLALQHSAGGTVLINDKFWIMEESYEVGPSDEKSPMQMGKIWLTDSNYSIRKMI